MRSTTHQPVTVRRAMLALSVCLALITAGLWVLSYWRALLVAVPLPGTDGNRLTIGQYPGRFVIWADLGAVPYVPWDFGRDATSEYTARLITLDEMGLAAWWRSYRQRGGYSLSSWELTVWTHQIAASSQGRSQREQSAYLAWNSRVTARPGPDWIGWELLLPHALPLTLLLTWPMFAAWRARRGRHRYRAGYCPVCDYDLRGSAGFACPECGQPVEAMPSPDIERAAA